MKFFEHEVKNPQITSWPEADLLCPDPHLVTLATQMGPEVLVSTLSLIHLSCHFSSLVWRKPICQQWSKSFVKSHLVNTEMEGFT